MTATVIPSPGPFAAECPICLTRAWDQVERKGLHHVVFRCKACGHRLDHKTEPALDPVVTPVTPPIPGKAV
jgi:hypothetical protein